ncbi:flagellar biosynthetic protein FliO [Puerhibacterium puerhi]|uniref:flagellar biosynthetic protein FliO n=1 Tax=Puerhibacterium puerhi TaxID=2692623 RepID=UPI001358F44E|nr:flagellar biosynthetic protein FliO [Puerhibacterium puerhi]
MGEGAVLVLRTLVALACVVGIIWYGARRLGAVRERAQAGEAPVRLVGRHALGRHAGVAVLAVGERRLLLGYGEQQVTLLTELDAVPEAAPDGAATVPTTVPTTVPATVPTTVPAAVPPPRALPARAPRALVPAAPDAPPAAAGAVPPVPGAPVRTSVLAAAAPRDFAEVITQELSVVRAQARAGAHAEAHPADAAVHATVPATVPATAPSRGRHGVRHAAALGRRGPVATAVAGSVLDPQTWRQVTHALQGRARR